MVERLREWDFDLEVEEEGYKAGSHLSKVPPEYSCVPFKEE